MDTNSLQRAARGLAAALVFAAAIAACGAAFAARTNGFGHPAAAPAEPAPRAGEPVYDSDSPVSCGGGLALPTPPMFGDAGDAVKDLSRATQSYISACHCATQACIADALDQYAEALALVAPRLPPRLQNAPGIVATAARRVRVARTKKEALSALHDAIAAIHKDIELVRAEDPDNFQRQTRGGDFVVDTLTVASLSLEKGGGL